MNDCNSISINFLPENKSLPFFSYGIFRPGEIAYGILEDLVDERKIEIKKINGELKLRDGILVYDNKKSGEIYGYLLHFKHGKEIEAYERIQKIEPKEYYTWNAEKSPYKGKFNILYARSVTSGVDEAISEFDSSLFESLFSTIWKDPFFIKGFQLLHELKCNNFFESTLNVKEYQTWHEEGNFNRYLKLQMLYIFLWSLIERFTFLAYGLGMNPNKRNIALSNDSDLMKSVQKLMNDPNFNYFKSGFERELSRTDSPGKKIKWKKNNGDEIDLKKMINFYYLLRSNITHRGKSGMRKSQLLSESFNELLFLIENLWEIKKEKALETKRRIDKIIKNEQTH